MTRYVRVFHPEVSGRIRRRRPMYGWRDSMKKPLVATGISVEKKREPERGKREWRLIMNG